MKNDITGIRKYVRALLSEMFISHTNEPVLGDHIVNVNPNCKHYGGEGIVTAIDELADDMGKTISYTCTNDGSNWDRGDILVKTMDQLDAFKA